LVAPAPVGFSFSPSSKERASVYTLTQKAGLLHSVRDEAVPAALSLVAAELFYHFHSFTLECGAFLLTWYAASYAWSRVARARGAVRG
jgi:hypothetical protein